MEKRPVLNAYVDDNGTEIVVWEQLPDRSVTERRVRAEYVSWHLATAINRERMRQLKQLPTVASVRVVGEWVRVGWNDEISRHMGRRGMKENEVESYEGDVDPVMLWLVEKRVTIGKPRRCYLDLEADSRVPLSRKEDMRILVWSITDHDTGEEIRGVLEEDTDASERELLSALNVVLQNYDQICAWEGDWKGGEFDSYVTPVRMRKRGINFDERRWLWVNQLAVWRKMNMQTAETGAEKESMALDNICFEQLGESKAKAPPWVVERFGSKKSLGALSWDLWNAGGEYRELLARYCSRDATLLRMLELKKGFLTIFQALCEVCGIIGVTRSLQPTRQMDGFLLRIGRERGIRFSTKAFKEADEAEEEEKQFRGAVVFHPKSVPGEPNGPDKWTKEDAAAWRKQHGFENGIIKNVHVCDFASLYPSVMRTWNLSADARVGWSTDATHQLAPDTCRSPGTGLVTRTDVEGIIPHALGELIRLRKVYSDLAASLPPGSPEWQDAQAKSNAYKVAANAFYGGGGSKYSRFNDRDVSEATTQNSVYLLRLAASEAERRSMVVVYGDTDSNMVIGPSEEGFRRFVTWLNEKKFPVQIASFGCKVNHIKLAFEKTFERVIFVSAKAYCNPPEAPVWMGDMTFKPLGDVVPGDEVVGWEEGDRMRGRSRTGLKRKRLVKARVVSVARSIAQIVKVTMASGRVIRCTPDHQWLRASIATQTKPKTGKRYEYRWCTPGVGREIVHVVSPPKPLPRSHLRSAAWLGGIWDGEGSCASTGRGQIVISQSPKANPEVCGEIERVLRLLGFDFGRWKRPSGDVFALRGRKQVRLDFLTWCKPVKRKHIEPGILKSKFGEADRIVSVVSDGEGEVISLTTTTGNYTAWGYASKNCGRFAQYKGTPAERECHGMIRGLRKGVFTWRDHEDEKKSKAVGSGEHCPTCGGIGKISGSPEIKGVAYKRGDKGKLARDLQGKIIDCLVGGVKIKDADGVKRPANPGIETPTEDLSIYHAIISKVRDHVLSDVLPIDECKLTKGISKPLREYAKPWPAHVVLAASLIERGQAVGQGSRIEYVVVDGECSPQRVILADDYNGELDRFYLWERVYEPSKALLEAAFPDHDWASWGKVRPKKPKGKAEKIPETQTGFQLAPRARTPEDDDELAVPTYTAKPLEIRVPEAGGELMLRRVEKIMRAHPGARSVQLVVVLKSGAEAILASKIRVSPGPVFKEAITQATTIAEATPRRVSRS